MQRTLGISSSLITIKHGKTAICTNKINNLNVPKIVNVTIFVKDNNKITFIKKYGNELEKYCLTFSYKLYVFLPVI
jgi:hypothetical protein